MRPESLFDHRMANEKMKPSKWCSYSMPSTRRSSLETCSYIPPTATEINVIFLHWTQRKPMFCRWTAQTKPHNLFRIVDGLLVGTRARASLFFTTPPQRSSSLHYIFYRSRNEDSLCFRLLCRIDVCAKWSVPVCFACAIEDSREHFRLIKVFWFFIKTKEEKKERKLWFHFLYMYIYFSCENNCVRTGFERNMI